MKKNVICMLVLGIACLLSGCQQQEGFDYMSWLPDTYSNSGDAAQNVRGEDYQLVQMSGTDKTSATTCYSAQELASALLNNESEKLAEYIWESQISNGVYSVTAEELNRNMLTYYVSSSEGDDNNMGLSPDSPKKTLGQFSGKSGITVLLKCGDVFEVEDSFRSGNNCIYATYGKGNRPIVSFYRTLDVAFEQMPEHENIWMADLVNIEGLYTGQDNKDNCNIGQLVIDGEINWKRVVVSTAESEEYDFAAALAQWPVGSWTVDWIQSKLYLYCEEDPNVKDILFAPDSHGIVFEATTDTELKGWTITGAGAHGCNITNSSNVSVANCFFYNIGGSVHRSAGIRYGNAVQVWDGGKDIVIAYNYADWIFDSCYTNQGSSKSSYCENVIFEKNIGAHSFTGIETWGDTYSELAFNNIVYRENIIYSMCDITDSEQYLYSDAKGQLVLSEEELKGYVSYRGGYTYNQMSCINVSGSAIDGELTIEDNVLWDTKRLLVLASDLNGRYARINGNFVHAETEGSEVCLFRYKDINNKIVYTDSFFIPGNEVDIYVKDVNTGLAADAKEHLEAAMGKIVNK